MNMKKGLSVFFGSWGVLLILTYLVGEPTMKPAGNFIATGVLAALIFGLYLIIMFRERKGIVRTVRSVENPGEVYRVDGMWIYEGTSERARWYMKKNGVYSFDSTRPIYRLKGGQILSADGAQVCWKVEGDKVISAATGRAEYEMTEMDLRKEGE